MYMDAFIDSMLVMKLAVMNKTNHWNPLSFEQALPIMKSSPVIKQV